MTSLDKYLGTYIDSMIQKYYCSWTHRPAGSRKHHRVGDSTRKVISNGESKTVIIVIVVSCFPPVWTTSWTKITIISSKLPQAENEPIVTWIRTTRWESKVITADTSRFNPINSCMCWVAVCMDLNFQDKVWSHTALHGRLEMRQMDINLWLWSDLEEFYCF